MGKYTTFEELKKARKKAYEAMAEGDVLGFLDQHSGFYPDPAHFIYELLQNAEDMEATEVTFRLFDDKLLFEHNGKKRDFNLEDIDAITNKGKSPKANDPTQIGKFGMGFKAVYVYTLTPEIHSGEYDFRIEHVIVPENSGVPKLSQKHFTQFIFPFDNPEKPAETAIREIIEDGFYKLNETSLLFLTNITKINYFLPDSSNGYISVKNNYNNIWFLTTITLNKPNGISLTSFWAKFSDDCPLMVSDTKTTQKSIKMFPVSIAYHLNKNINDIFIIDSEFEGKICLFFPTEMDSLFHFHINAPFASTVARDVILSKGEEGISNQKLINKLAELTAESLHWLKKANILNYDAYAMLPTIRDFNNHPNSRYKVFAIRVKQEFEKEKLFITEEGNYCSLDEIMKASKDIKTILPIKYVKNLYGKSWIPTVPSVTRVEYFLDQFSIEEYTIENFIDSLEKDYTFFDSLLLEKINETDYFKTLYALFASSRARDNYYYYYSRQKKTRNEILQNVKFLLCEDKSLHTPNDKIYLKTSYKPYHYLKNPLYLDIKLRNSEQDRKIRDFLLLFENINEMSESEDVYAVVSGDTIPDDDLVQMMMEIVAGYMSGTIDVMDFIDKEIFIGYGDDGKNYVVQAKECCWTKDLTFFYKNTNYIIAINLYQEIGSELLPITILKEIFEKLGGKTRPEFIETLLCDDHPQFGDLNKTGVERGDTRIRKDYRIGDLYNMKDLIKIKENNLYGVSLLLWNQVLKENGKDKLRAVYRANKSCTVQYLESSLVYYLKRIPWVNTKSGEYKRPYELSEDDLLNEFKYEKSSLLLAEISKAPHDIADQLKNSGINDDNILAIAQYDPDILAQLRIMGDKLQEQKQKKGKSLSELSDSSDRAQLPEEDDDFYGIPHKSKNLDNRRIKLEKEFYEREQPATPLRRLQFVLEKPSSEEKFFVQQQYSSHCQICKNEGILTAKGKRYFEAINIFNTAKLDEKLQINLDSGWNTLCLCPNCAAKFKYSQITISGLIEQAEAIDVNSIQSAFVDIYIVLEEKPTTIQFTPKHLLALQVAIKKIKQIETESDED